METLDQTYQPNFRAIGNYLLQVADRVGGESEGEEDLLTSCGD